MPMTTLSYTVRFTTPAFLGNAEQAGQWRTPPFKALLRQWWRVVYAADRKFDVNLASMRREEGTLFGNAWLSHRDGNRDITDFSKSLVRLRLEVPPGGTGEAWAVGTQRGVAPLPTGLATSYAWFGLVNRGDGQPDRSGIRGGTSNESVRLLRISVPSDFGSALGRVMRLINMFGLLGSRSRGGWGALSLEGVEAISAEGIKPYSRPLSNCLKSDWAASLASDEHGLCIWESKSTFSSWDKAMQAIAGERKRVRSALKTNVDLRPAIGFASAGRMPSPLRWKAIPSSEGGLAIRVFALPHGLPDGCGKSLPPDQLSRAWTIVCDTIDSSQLFVPRTDR